MSDQDRPGVTERPIRVLVVDDDETFRFVMERRLRGSGHHVECVGCGEAALDRLASTAFDVILLDLRMPGLSGVDTLRRLREADVAAQVVMLTGHPDYDDCVEAMRLGAFHYLRKPMEPALIEETLLVAAAHGRLDREVTAFRRMHGSDRLPAFIGESPAARALVERIRQVAPTTARVIITGETGTGKGLVARMLHEHSRRHGKIFVDVHCGAIPRDLLESELFGHERGAFTGAVMQKRGLFELADGGTLFLDEFAEMGPEMQTKLLKVLDSGEFRRVGGTRTMLADVRLLVATNRDLDELLRTRRLREDLLHRLNVLRIPVPPLRERREDIPRMVAHFLAQQEQRGLPARTVTPRAMRLLEAYRWPGNVRELVNTMEQLSILAPRAEVEVADLPENIRLPAEPAVHSNDGSMLTLQAMERRHVDAVLRQVRGNRAAAARLLGIDRNTLVRKLRQWERTDEGPEPADEEGL
jgi:DNA-binding NtrC family response regulator